MAASDPTPDTKQDDSFLSLHAKVEPRSWMPWIVASAVVLLSLFLLVLLSRHSGSSLAPGGIGMAAAAPYAANLPVTNLQMSQATSFAGSKVTYIDGRIANSGSQTVTAITVQVGFRDDLGQLAQRTVMPLTLIRTREPYIDTEPVSAAPLKPGDSQDFRLIFDSLPPDWNQQFPEIRIVGTRSR